MNPTSEPTGKRATFGTRQGAAHVDLEAMHCQSESFGLPTRYEPLWCVLSLSAIQIPNQAYDGR